jgi:hypothetical protein
VGRQPRRLLEVIIVYRVEAKLPNKGASVTSHETATEALGMVQKIRREGGEASVEDRFGKRVSDSLLSDLVAREAK